MPGERNIEEAIEKGRVPILRGVFVEPTRFRESLEPLGIHIGPEDPIGVLDAKTIEGEMKRMAVTARFARPAARAIVAELRNSEYPRLFSPSSGLTIEGGRVGDEKFYRRSNISDEAAHKRLGAYQILLEKEAERLASEKLESTAEKEAARTRPSTAVIRILTTFTLDTYKKRVKELEDSSTGRQVVEEIPHDIEGNIDAVARVIQRPDALKILENGLDANQFRTLLELVRAGIVKSSDKDQIRNADVAAKVLEYANKRIENPGHDVDLPIYFPRDIYQTMYHQIEDLNQDPNITLEVDVEKSKFGDTQPLPRHVMNIWAGRFDDEVLPDYLDEIKVSSPKVGEAIENTLLSENSEQILRELRLGGNLSVDGKNIDKKELDKVLAPIVLPDKIIAQTIFADLVGELYPIPYHPLLNGEPREIGLHILRFVAEGLSVSQIQAALAPHVVLREVPQITTLHKQLAGIEGQLKTIKGTDKSSNQRRQALEKQKTQLSKRLEGLEKQKISKTPNNVIVQKIIEESLQVDTPKPKDFGHGENSVGYKQALKRYKLQKEANPEEPIPDPDDFILEDESDGFNRVKTLYEVYQAIQPEEWITDWKTGEPAAKTHRILKEMLVPAILPEGVFEISTTSVSQQNQPKPDFDTSKLSQIPGLPF